MKEPVGDKGATQRDHLLAAAKRGHLEAIKALDGPYFPEVVGYLYAWFMQLNNGRRIGVNGPERITYADIYAWSVLTGNNPQPQEVEALMQVDAAYLYPGPVDG